MSSRQHAAGRSGLGAQKNFWLAEGFSGGILMGGGIGHELVNWIVDGEPNVDLTEVDPRRFGDYANKVWTGKKNTRILWAQFRHPLSGLRVARGPARQDDALLRPANIRPGAVWGAVYGWEVPLWFAPEGEEARDIWSYRTFNSMPHVGAECRAVRDAVGLIEMSPMAKFEASGPGAEAWLNRVLANRMPRKPGGMVLAHLLTHKGTVRAEFTVTRLDEELFYLVGTPRGERHDFDCLQKSMPRDGSVTLPQRYLRARLLYSGRPQCPPVARAPGRCRPLERGLSLDEGEVGHRRPCIRRPHDAGELRRRAWLGALSSDPYNLHLFNEIVRTGEEHGLKHAGLSGDRIAQARKVLPRHVPGHGCGAHRP